MKKNLIYVKSIGTSEKAMATHSSTLAWKIPWIEEPGGLHYRVEMGSGGYRNVSFYYKDSHKNEI